MALAAYAAFLAAGAARYFSSWIYFTQRRVRGPRRKGEKEKVLAEKDFGIWNLELGTSPGFRFSDFRFFPWNLELGTSPRISLF
jgi:hypothetical protein